MRVPPVAIGSSAALLAAGFAWGVSVLAGSLEGVRTFLAFLRMPPKPWAWIGVAHNANAAIIIQNVFFVLIIISFLFVDRLYNRLFVDRLCECFLLQIDRAFLLQRYKKFSLAKSRSGDYWCFAPFILPYAPVFTKWQGLACCRLLVDDRLEDVGGNL